MSEIRERDIIFLMREFSKVSRFVIRSTRHRNLCDTPPRSCVRTQCDSLHAIHRVSPRLYSGCSCIRVICNTRGSHHARRRLRNVNNGESSPEWPTRL